MKIQFQLNGAETAIDSAPLSRLLDVIRIDLGLTATKEGCGEGECGSCSILVDGEVVNSCLIPIIQVQGRKVETLESVLEANGRLSDLQKSMLAADGAQCGICTPGMIMAGTAFLQRLKQEGRPCRTEEIREAIAGNLCRCTGYGKIIDAIMMAAQEKDGGLLP